MITLTFINHAGQEFTATSEELHEEGVSVIAYIKYCLDRKSTLVSLTVEGEEIV